MSCAGSEYLLLYADGSVVVADKSIPDIESLLGKGPNVVNDWTIDYKLSLHLGKTEYFMQGQHYWS